MTKSLLIIFSFLCLLSMTATVSGVENAQVKQTEHIYKVIDGTKLTIHAFADTEALKGNPHSAIDFIHGGGWASGEPSVFFAACERYAAMGFTTFSVEYRLAENNKGDIPSPKLTPIECVLDVRSAMRWVRAHAEDFGIDPQKIVVGGHSVGGQLTLATAMFDSINEATDNLSVSPVPNAMLLYSGTPDTIEAWCDYLLADRRQQIWTISPAHNVRPGLPPAIAFHGKADHVVPFWKVGRLRGFMEKAGNYFELHAYDGREHYLGKGNKTYAEILDNDILEKTDAFLRKFGFM
jgi:acetyl esterase